MCCWMGCTREGVSQQGPSPSPTFWSHFILQLPAARRRQLGEPDRGVGIWKGHISDLCHPLCCGSPQSRAMAHGPRVADVAPSLTRATPKTSCPHPPGVAPHPPADPRATSKVHPKSAPQGASWKQRTLSAVAALACGHTHASHLIRPCALPGPPGAKCPAHPICPAPPLPDHSAGSCLHSRLLPPPQ